MRPGVATIPSTGEVGAAIDCPFCADTLSGPCGKTVSTIGLRRFREGTRLQKSG